MFLAGGVDSCNFLIPADSTSYTQYGQIRANIAYTDPTKLFPVSFQSAQGIGNFYLPPGANGAQALHQNGQLAALANIGTLFTPTTLTQYQQRSVPIPPKLFSHNDQQSVWQSGELEITSADGFGAHLMEVLGASNPFSCISLSGRSIYLNSDYLLQYQVSRSGPTALATDGANLYGSTLGPATSRELMRMGPIDAFGQSITTQNAGALDLNAQLSTALAGIVLPVVMPNTTMGGNLGMVAKLIACAGSLGVSRQSFFVSMGGFDMHDYLIRDYEGKMKELWDALLAFEQNLVALGAAQNVLTYTASDFGRNMVSNGDGSDHGWGGHQFVIAPGAQSRQFGTFPQMALKTSTDVGNGALLPTSSHEQLMAMVARFMGLSDNDISLYLPYSRNFESWRW